MDDRDWMADLIEAAREALRLVEAWETTPNEWRLTNQRAIERHVEVVATAGANLSEPTRRRIDHDWRGLKDLRNFVAHQYHHIDRALMFQLVRENFPSLIHQAELVFGDP